MSETPRCAAYTHQGKLCRNPALPNQRYCQQHMHLHATHAQRERAVNAPAHEEADEHSSRPIAPPQDSAATDAPCADERTEEKKPAAPQPHHKQLSAQTGGLLNALVQMLKQHRLLGERRRHGIYQTDPYGMDSDMLEVVRPFFRYMYREWWRIQAEGLEHVPASGRALLVANHSGVLPWDGAMITTAILEDHPTPRLVRNLYLNWFNSVPFIAPIFTGLGQLAGLPENAIRLLEEDELVCTFPEGVKGIAKLFRQRYQLARFGRGGFVKVALRTGAPIIPVVVVGAEEIYPLLSRGEPVARLLGMPIFPITPFFPWLGLLGMIPLPTRWSITFCPPVPTTDYGPAAADDPLVVFSLAGQVQRIIQQTIYAKLAARKSIF